MDVPQFDRLSVEGRVSCFQFMAIMHQGAINIGVQAFVRMFPFFQR